jgi:thiol-disulfide isomerase/thioredoxin
MLKKQISMGLAIVAGLGLLFHLASLGARGPSQAVPDVALPLQKGAAPTRLSELKGKVVLLDFWATWCGPCRQSIPELAELYGKYKDSGLEIIGVSVDEKETQAMIPVAQRELGINYPIVLSEEVPGIDTQFKYEYLPTLYIIDKQGKIRHKMGGYDPGIRLDDLVVPLLDE